MTSHVFAGVLIFIVLAFPAIALDFFNQEIELLQFQPSTLGSVPTIEQLESTNVPSDTISKSRAIRVSSPVKLTLNGVEYLILGAYSAPMSLCVRTKKDDKLQGFVNASAVSDGESRASNRRLITPVIRR